MILINFSSLSLPTRCTWWGSPWESHPGQDESHPLAWHKLQKLINNYMGAGHIIFTFAVIPSTYVCNIVPGKQWELFQSERTGLAWSWVSKRKPGVSNTILTVKMSSCVHAQERRKWLFLSLSLFSLHKNTPVIKIKASEWIGIVEMASKMATSLCFYTLKWTCYKSCLFDQSPHLLEGM